MIYVSTPSILNLIGNAIFLFLSCPPSRISIDYLLVFLFFLRSLFYLFHRERQFSSAMMQLTAQESEQLSIFGPVFATMLLTIVVWVYMYVRRIHFLYSINIRPEQLARHGELARISPPAVSNPSDNLKNLFEMPVLFYTLSLYLFVSKQVDTGYVVAAWIFFLFRVLHSSIHCTFNAILPRFYCYLLSCIALFFMLFRAALVYLFS